MSKKIVVIFLLFIISSIIHNNYWCFAEEKGLNDYVDENLDSLDLNQIESFINENINSEIDLKSLIKDVINGKFSGGISEFINLVFDIYKQNILSLIPTILSIIGIAILFSLLEGMSSGFLNKEITSIIQFVCFITIVLISSYMIFSVLKDVESLILKLSKFMQLVFPILLSIITLLGGKISNGIYQPCMSILANSITIILVNVVLPLITASIIILIVSNLSDKIKLEKLSKLLRTIATFVITTIFSIFVIYLSFQGLTSGVVDTVSIKNAKYAIESYIPILGGYLSDGFDLISAAVVLIKNSFGYLIVIYLITIIAVPVIKIIVISIALKFASAIIEPIGYNKASNFLYSISKSIMLYVGVILAIFAMFLITIMLCILSLNIGV